MAGFLIALLSGALMSVQGVFNAQVTKTTGIWVSNGWVQLSAFLLCLFVWLATGRDSVVALMEVQPRYMLLGSEQGSHGLSLKVWMLWDLQDQHFSLLFPSWRLLI